MLVHDFLTAAAADRLGDKVALVSGPRRFTYAELAAASLACAAALRRLRVGRGDRVLVMAPSGAEAAIGWWGALAAGAVAVMVSPQTKAAKLAFLVGDCDPAAVVVDSAFLAVCAEALDVASGSTGRRPALLVSGRPADLVDVDRAAWPPRAELFHEAVAAEEPGRPPRAQPCLDIDLAALIYTSGSTGEPKGVMLTHRNITAAAESICQYLGLVEDDVILNALPLAFDYGLYQLILAARQGARVVLEPSFSPPMGPLARAAAERVTVLPGVPTLFALLDRLGDPHRWDLSAVTTVTSTGAALPPSAVATVRRWFPGARLFSMYGLTECKRCTYLPPEDLDRKAGSVGLAIPNTELWLSDGSGRRLGAGDAGRVGELVVRGATVMAGYWNRPEETARTLRPGSLPGERVLHTGDLCRVDDDGYLYVVGRCDDVLKRRGQKVAPAEIEAALHGMAGVGEAAVVGVADEVEGAVPHAYVVARPGVTLAEADLLAACRQLLEPLAVPARIHLVADLPRSPNGKVRRSDLGR